jgi:hypothetical protein
MKRRKILAGVGTAFGLAGCSSNSTTANNRRTSSTTAPEPTTETTDDGRTSTTTGSPELVVEKTLAFEDWYSWTDWTFTVTDLTLTNEYQLEDEAETRQMPEGQQLAITTLDIRTDVEYDGWAGDGGIAFIIDQERALVTSETEFPDPLPGHTNLHELQRVEHFRQYRTEGYSISDDETGTVWYLTVVDSSVALSDVEIGFDGDFNDQKRYPIRWDPDA